MKKVKSPLWLNLYFLLGIAVSLYGLIKTHFARINLPPNTCPIEDNNGILRLGIGLLISYLLIAIIYEWCNRKRIQANE